MRWSISWAYLEIENSYDHEGLDLLWHMMSWRKLYTAEFIYTMTNLRLLSILQKVTQSQQFYSPYLLKTLQASNEYAQSSICANISIPESQPDEHFSTSIKFKMSVNCNWAQIERIHGKDGDTLGPDRPWAGAFQNRCCTLMKHEMIFPGS